LDWSLRSVIATDTAFLQEMLFEAAYWRSNIIGPGLERGLKRPDLAYLLLDWVRLGDAGVLTIDESGRSLGATWYRLWTVDQHSYGFVSEDTPELAIAVHRDFRGKGIGMALVRELVRTDAENEISQISHSVEADNPERRIYERVGFTKVSTADGACKMVCHTDTQQASGFMNDSL